MRIVRSVSALSILVVVVVTPGEEGGEGLVRPFVWGWEGEQARKERVRLRTDVIIIVR